MTAREGSSIAAAADLTRKAASAFRSFLAAHPKCTVFTVPREEVQKLAVMLDGVTFMLEHVEPEPKPQLRFVDRLRART